MVVRYAYAVVRSNGHEISRGAEESALKSGGPIACLMIYLFGIDSTFALHRPSMDAASAASGAEMVS